MRAYFNKSEQLVVEAETVAGAMALKRFTNWEDWAERVIIHVAVMPEPLPVVTNFPPMPKVKPPKESRRTTNQWKGKLGINENEWEADQITISKLEFRLEQAERANVTLNRMISDRDKDLVLKDHIAKGQDDVIIEMNKKLMEKDEAIRQLTKKVLVKKENVIATVQLESGFTDYKFDCPYCGKSLNEDFKNNPPKTFTICYCYACNVPFAVHFEGTSE